VGVPGAVRLPVLLALTAAGAVLARRVSRHRSTPEPEPEPEAEPVGARKGPS
jgi:hypothetical protein